MGEKWSRRCQRHRNGRLINVLTNYRGIPIEELIKRRMPHSFWETSPRCAPGMPLPFPEDQTDHSPVITFIIRKKFLFVSPLGRGNCCETKILWVIKNTNELEYFYIKNSIKYGEAEKKREYFRQTFRSIGRKICYPTQCLPTYYGCCLIRSDEHGNTMTTNKGRFEISQRQQTCIISRLSVNEWTSGLMDLST